MTVDLQKYEVSTDREVYGWASQSSESRKPGHYQVESLKAIVYELPLTTPNVLFGKGIHVARKEKSKAGLTTAEQPRKYFRGYMTSEAATLIANMRSNEPTKSPTKFVNDNPS